VLYVGSGDRFSAMDAKTGEKIWTNTEMGGSWISCLTSPAVDKGSVLMGLNWSKGLYALNRRNGEIKWNAAKGFGTSHCTPAISGDRVYHAADSKLHALDAATSEVVWSFPLPGGWTQSSPAVSGQKVVVGGPDGKVYCVDAQTGKEVWSTSTGREILFFQPYARNGNPVASSPAISGDVVYCGGGDGRLRAFDLADGKVMWAYDLGVPVTSSPAVSGNAVYVCTFDGTLYAFATD
jgi:outer membrane protein assembly factor BamB